MNKIRTINYSVVSTFILAICMSALINVSTALAERSISFKKVSSYGLIDIRYDNSSDPGSDPTVGEHKFAYAVYTAGKQAGGNAFLQYPDGTNFLGTVTKIAGLTANAIYIYAEGSKKNIDLSIIDPHVQIIVKIEGCTMNKAGLCFNGKVGYLEESLSGASFAKKKKTPGKKKGKDKQPKVKVYPFSSGHLLVG